MTYFTLKTIDKGASSEITTEKHTLNKSGISSWLINKNLITINDNLIEFNDLTPWARSGGETYLTSFRFKTESITKQIILKAIVTSFPNKRLDDWARRRKILIDNNIPVSNWYYYNKAIIIEDYYPNNAFTFVSFDKLLSIGYKLDILGFSTLKFLEDIRSDAEGNPFFIDFGFDLGEPSETEKTSAKNYLLKFFPEKTSEINTFYFERNL
jgi:hypothetical protein